MKRTFIFLCLVIISMALNAQIHIPASKSFVGFWQLKNGMMHGSGETTGMYCINNSDGTFYLFTTSGTNRAIASILQYGTYKMTSDSTCTEQIVKHTTNPAMDGKIFLIKFRLRDDDTLISSWSLGNDFWMSEEWSRVK